MIHIEGKLYDGGDGVEIQDYCGSLAEKMASEIWSAYPKCKKSKLDVDEDNDQIEASYLFQEYLLEHILVMKNVL